MKKSLCQSLVAVWSFLLITSHVSAQKVNVPYFGKMKASYLCGSVTKNNSCQPKNERLYAPVTDKFYNGQPAAAFRMFTESYYSSSPLCAGTTPPQASDTEEFNKNQISAKVKSSSKTEFSGNLTAALDDVLRTRLPALPEDFKAEIKARFGTVLSSALEKDIQMEYKAIQLTTDYVDQKIMPCLNSSPAGTSVATGLSVLTLKGSWSSDIFKKALIGAEASASYQALSAEAKAQYDAEKRTLLAGSFEPFSIIFKISYKTKA